MTQSSLTSISVATAQQIFKQKKFIMFDLDGTLVDSVPDLHASMNQALTALQRPLVSYADLLQWVGRGAAPLCQSVLESQGTPEQPFDSQQHQQLMRVFLEIYQNNICVHTRLYDGVMQCLDYCKQQGKKIACVTNKPYSPTVALLKQLQLEHYFDLVVGGDSLTERKPHPAPLLYSVQTLEQTVQDSLMIGDSRNDIEAARRAMIDCIAVSYGYNHGESIVDSKPQWVVDSLAELLT